MIHAGDVISTPGAFKSPTFFMFSTMGKYHDICVGSGVFSTPRFMMISPMVLKISFTVLKISSHGSEHLYGTEHTLYRVPT